MQTAFDGFESSRAHHLDNMQIKAICFDLDGVYFTSAGFSSFKQAICDMGVSKEDVDYILHGEPMEAFKCGEVEEEAFWEHAIQYWRIPIGRAALLELLPKGYEVNQEVEDFRARLKEGGYQVCICSNNFTTRVRLLDKKFNFLSKFDVAVFSYDVGVLKPNKEIFRALVEKLNCLPEEIVYSDDNEDKLVGAKELGIQCFVYEDFESFKQQLISHGVSL